MNQITQKLKNGKITVTEVPIPQLNNGEILVKNIYSCVSSGTESSTIQTARKGYFGKAKARPHQVAQVIDKLKTEGPLQTYRTVMKKLDVHSPLGYSCVGEVIEIAPDINEFEIGDIVACGGSTACHAEVVTVSKNLCIKISPNSDFKQAAYNTLGAIALQGVRQADLRLAETCAVIGLGLIGQLTCVLLKSSGINVIGVDIDPTLVDIANKHCADIAFLRNEPGIENKISEFSYGIGCDAVIITAASSSCDPINFAGAISRKRGRVVVVGVVPTGFNREPHYYTKELSVKMSCSYGPGRYDPEYEEKGHDYPLGYVRWTEKRNMHAFQELIASKKIDISYMTSHVFNLHDTGKMYDMILEKKEKFLGILIAYDTLKNHKKNRNCVEIKKKVKKTRKKDTLVSIGVIGAGSYAQSSLLPNIPKGNSVLLKGVMTKTGANARSVADRFGFEYCTGKADDIFENNEINTVFITSRHDSHGKYVLQALKKRMHIFVEKPLCLTKGELTEINKLIVENEKCGYRKIFMVGYNRRFSVLSGELQSILQKKPFSTIYRINAGAIPKESWIHDIKIGGGRIIGEVCHFIDYLTFLNNSFPVKIHAVCMKHPDNLQDTLSVNLQYKNGSIGTINYFANGSKALSKEYIEVYQSGMTAILDNFKKLSIASKEKNIRKKLLNQDKGQKQEVKLFIDSIKNDTLSPIPYNQIYNTSMITFKVIESIRSGQAWTIYT